MTFPCVFGLNIVHLGLFETSRLDQDTFREVTKRLTDESLEIREEDGISRFLEELARLLPTGSHLSHELLLVSTATSPNCATLRRSIAGVVIASNGSISSISPCCSPKSIWTGIFVIRKAFWQR